MSLSALQRLSEGRRGLTLKEDTYYVVMCVLMRTIKMKKWKIKNSDTFLGHSGLPKKKVRTTVRPIPTCVLLTSHHVNDKLIINDEIHALIKTRRKNKSYPTHVTYGHITLVTKYRNFKFKINLLKGTVNSLHARKKWLIFDEKHYIILIINKMSIKIGMEVRSRFYCNKKRFWQDKIFLQL